MLVSHDHKFIFLKPPKTAGSSIEAVLRRFCLPSDFSGDLEGHVFPETVTQSGIVTVSGNTAPTNSPLKPHMSAIQARHLLGPEVFDEYVKVSVVREPFSRAVSLFWWHLWQDHKDDYARLLTADRGELRLAFEKFLSEKKRFIRWASLNRFVDRRVLGERSLLVRYESLAADINNFLGEIDQPSLVGEIPRHKSGIRNLEWSVRDHYTVKAAYTIRFLWQRDISRLRYSWRLPTT